ncbi:hypothetical protein GTO27_11855 [Candidatus Bathyarchaeota archaeon]|nr:hypothetical protein [Candidatus Bathyarchaeota archaeon]
MAESMPLLIAAQIRRKCLKKLKEAKAYCPGTAVTMDQLKLDWLEKRHLKILIKKKKVVETGDGRYYVEGQDKNHC